MIRRVKSKRTTSKAAGASKRSAHAYLKRLAAEQGIKPMHDLDKLGAPLAVEPDPDAMIRFIMEERAARRQLAGASRKRKLS
jgi:hypothetical protein